MGVDVANKAVGRPVTVGAVVNMTVRLSERELAVIKADGRGSPVQGVRSLLRKVHPELYHNDPERIDEFE